jgi:hypothetical protein
VVEFEGDTGMSLVHEEDLTPGQKESVEERSVLMDLGHDEVQIRQSEKEYVRTELEEGACEVNVTEQANVEVPSINPVIRPRFYRPCLIAC